MVSGWVKLHRKIFENPVCCKDAEHFFVWCWILSNATCVEKHVLFNGQDTVLKKGELITTSKFIANELKINESKVNRILRKFESEKQIERQTSNRNTIICVVNWRNYQLDENQNGKQMKDKLQTNEEENALQQAKAVKIKNETRIQVLDRLLHEANITDYLVEYVNDWLEYKKERKFVYKETGLKILLKQISENATKYGDESVAHTISISIASGYQGIVWDILARSQRKSKNDIGNVNSSRQTQLEYLLNSIREDEINERNRS